MWRIVALLALVVGSTLAHATDDQDWVLEQRFKSQLQLADKGDKDAQYEVGRMYEKGRGVGRDPSKAVEYLDMAATQGHTTAKAELGIMYLEGKGMRPDYGKAFTLLLDAASHGIPNAQFYLAQCYEEGKGTRQSLSEALKWYKTAAGNGYYPARARVEEVAGRLTAARQAPAAAAPAPAVAHAAPPVAMSDPAVIVLKGQWQRGGKPSGYLPSTLTVCEQKPDSHVECISKEQQRNMGVAIVTYITRATLKNFTAKGSFTIAYTNEVLAVKEVKQQTVDGVAPVRIPVKVGDHEAEHQLICQIMTDKAVSCVKDRLRELQFTSK